MRIGARVSVSRVFEPAEIAAFHSLAGAPEADASTVPEPLVAGMISYLLGVELPGRGTNYLKQSLDFHHAAPASRTLVASVEITRLRPEKHLCDLATTIVDADGRLIATGRALVYVEDVAAGDSAVDREAS
ncbi:phosphate acetyltransferase [Prosthecodimorpha staleyi]|uniref:Phosphate acetyltransferase n=1 Tax=Prosthecodimorpha staleyi TaxID=2840188 RepID=A0A947D8X0_9HYPH|nr:phosphate acetyltransferase [Prosthecodimorpha staleyi]MBT9290367.1 phosphate acetyltransferase [Prosthecodimorpha staleyi]